MTIGEELVALCKEGKDEEAVAKFYHDDIVSIEARSDDTMPAKFEGLEAVKKKHEWWNNTFTVNDSTAEGPFPGNDPNQFAVIFSMDVTQKDSGENWKMKEIALYTTDGEKIIREEFFYGGN